MTNMTIIGIDPGTNGGICVKVDGVIKVHKMPDTPKDIYDLLCEYRGENSVCYLEDVGHGIPGQSSKATATFARHNGHLEMALVACGIKTIKVTPQKWQKSYSNTIGKSTGVEKKEWKNKLKALAQQLFPNEKITLWNADALLILEYGCTQNK